MLLVQYVLVIATCIQQSLVGASVLRKYSLPKSTTGGEPSRFSFRKFRNYVERSYEKSLLFSKQRDILKLVKEGYTFTDINEDTKSVINDWIQANGKFPNFQPDLASKGICITKKLKEGKEKFLNSDKQREKLNLLKNILKGKVLDKSDELFVEYWLKEDVIKKVTSVVQRNSLNGKPDEDTKELFNSLAEPVFESVKVYFPDHDYNIGYICERMSHLFFSPPPKFVANAPTPSPDAPQVFSDEGTLVNEIGVCREKTNPDIFYFRVAIAKAEESKDAEVFHVQYFIAFDEYIEDNTGDGFTIKPQVAISFAEAYKMKEKHVYIGFKPHFSALNANNCDRTL